VSQIRDLTAADAAAKVRAGELSADELFEAYREAAAGVGGLRAIEAARDDAVEAGGGV